jgi:plastocyanin
MRIRSTWRVLAALAVLVLVASACGKDSNAASSGNGSTTAGPTASTSTTGSSGSSGSSGGGYSRYGGGNGGGGGNGDQSNDSGGGDSGGDAGDVTVTANNYAFDPGKATVASGTELYLKNANANTPHTFTIDGTDIDVALDPMTTQDVKIDLDPGSYDFHCKIHPTMTGTLTVT